MCRGKCRGIKTESDSREWQRGFTREEAEECVPNLESKEATGANEGVGEFIKYGGEEMKPMMAMLCNKIWENECTSKR